MYGIKLTDGKKTVEITMTVWQGTGYSPDWSMDFFDAGVLEYDREKDVHIVEDVDYCIDMALEWESEDENNAVTVTEL